MTDMKPLLLIIVGRSCTGKTNLVKKLSNKFFKSKSFTTRPKRKGEVDGEDYHFITPAEFMKMQDNGEFYEFVEYNNHLYGCNTKSFDFSKDNVIIMEPQGARKIKEILKDKFRIIVVQLEASDKTILSRFRQRGDDIDTIMERFKRDKELFSDIEPDIIINKPQEFYIQLLKAINNKKG